MLCCLLQVTDTGGVRILGDDSIQPLRRHDALILPETHASQDLRQRKFGKNYLFLFFGIVRNVDDRKARHQRRTDLALVIGRCNRIYAYRRYHTLHIVVGKAQVIQQSQQYIRRIAVALACIGLVQLVDDEDQIGFAGDGKSFHDDAGFCIGIDPGAAGQLLRIVDGAHIQGCPGQLQDPRHRVGDLGFSGSGRSHQ